VVTFQQQQKTTNKQKNHSWHEF